jgi:hypothetical protein
MPITYLPTRESELLTWCYEFLTNITPLPSRYGLNQTQAEDYQASYNRFELAYNKVHNPLTRTPPNFAAKGDAKRHLINATRMLVNVCQNWPQMTDELRRELKITVRDREPSPAPLPSMPIVKIVSVNGREVKLSIQQSKTTNKKPKGVILANVMVAYGDTPPQTTEGWQFVRATGRTRVDVLLDGVMEPTIAWISAFWVTGLKQTSQASLPQQVSLGAMTASPVSVKEKKAA